MHGLDCVACRRGQTNHGLWRRGNTIFQLALDEIFPRNLEHSFLSKDILSIEASDPKYPHLTVVDLPGIIHTETMNQSLADKDAILSLAEGYMGKERTIILPVVSCSNDISNQAVLDMAKRLDPQFIRGNSETTTWLSQSRT
jgi:hypothetical protein